MQFDKISKTNLTYYLLYGIFAAFFVFKNYYSIDIITSDEVVYLNSSKDLIFPFQNNYNGAIYSIWYYVINFFTQDPINTYYFNYFFLSIIPAFLLLVLLIEMGYNKSLSLIITLLLLFSPFNLYLLPKISQLAVILIIVALLFIRKTERIFEKLFIIGIATLIISYIRPEYYVAFVITIILMVIIMCFEIFKEKYFSKFDLYKIAILAMIGIGFYILFGGTPLSNRSFDAFVQHYIRNYCEQYNVIHPPTIPGEFKLFHEVYSSRPNNLLEAAIEEPNKFLWHILINLKNNCIKIPQILYEILFGGFISITPLFIKVIKILSVLILLILVDWKRSFKNFHFRKYFIEFLKIFLLFFPIFIGIILVYPREHYLVVLLILCFISILEIIDNLEVRNFIKTKFNISKNTIFIEYFSFLLILLLLIQSKRSTNYSEMYRLGRNISKITHLTLIDDYFSKIYYGNRINYVDFVDYDGKRKFIDFINTKKIEFIHVNKEQGLLRLAKNESFIDFENNFSKYGFNKIYINGVDDVLFINNALYDKFLLNDNSLKHSLH